jgi:branched-chain amino acid transport system permease protein
LIIALIVMLALIGWRSRGEIAAVGHQAHAAVHRARVPWPAPLRLALIAAATVFACWLAYQLAPFDVGLYDRMGLYALVAVGLTLLMGFAGQISLGQGAFFLIGAYTSAILTVGVDPARRIVDPDAGVSPVLAVLAAPVVTAAIAAVIGLPLLRLRGHYLAFATLSLHLIAFSLLYAWDRFTGGQYGISVTKPLEIGGWTIRGADHAALVWVLVGLVLVLTANLVHSRVGRALQALATDEASAAASGIPVASYKLRLFVFAAALAGIGGGLFTFAFQFVSPEAFPVVLSVEFVVMVAVGGLGNVYGAVAGTIAILYLEQKLREVGARDQLLGWGLPDAAPTVFSYGVFGLILIVIMLFFPRGLLPALGDLTARASGRAHRRRVVAPGAGGST